jgi:predicted RNase H-like HicB family nuclease
MLCHYIEAAMRHAKYEILQDDNSYYGEIPGFDGEYANAPTLDGCREQLVEVLEDWILIGVAENHSLPPIDGITMAANRTA